MALHWFGLGTGAPPATIMGYTMVPFGDDVRSIPGAVTTVPAPSPFSGNLTFDQTLTHTEVGTGWATWSHGYTGDIYFVAGPDQEDFTILLTLPANAGCFYFYAEPDAFTSFTIKATCNDGTNSGHQPVHGVSGAYGFSFYADAGQIITTIEIVCPSSGASVPAGIAIGEFGIGEGSGDTTITFSKTIDVDDPQAEFIISVGPGLDPATFILKGGESATYVVDPEETYFCSEGQVCGWSQTAIVVSSGTADEIEPVEGEDVTVEFQNATAPVIPGENGCAPITTTRRLIRRMRQSPHIANQGERSIIHNWELWMDTGVGLNSSEGQGSDPMIHLEVSKDGGATWGPSRPMSVGKLGDYRKRVMWWQLGQARDWVFRVTCSDPVAWRLVQAYMDLEPGTS